MTNTGIASDINHPDLESMDGEARRLYGYALALGYAKGVRDASPSGVSLGVDGPDDELDFARAYRKHVGDGGTRGLASAFGCWRYDGSIADD